MASFAPPRPPLIGKTVSFVASSDGPKPRTMRIRGILQRQKAALALVGECMRTKTGVV